MTPAHKEMTAHIRNRIKVSGIKARVRGYEACGRNYIAVDVAKYGDSFNPAEAREIALIGHVNKLTFSHGMPIDHSDERWQHGNVHFTFEFAA